MPKQPAVYIIARNTTALYTLASPVTCRSEWFNIVKKIVEGFSKQYGIKLLVYFELCDEMLSAIAREKALKGITRAKKIALIESVNPKWEDLAIKLELLKP